MKTSKLNTKDSVVNKKFTEEDKKIISYPKMDVEEKTTINEPSQTDKEDQSELSDQG